MPEILEIEMYRRAAAVTVGRAIRSVRAPDDWYLKGTDASALTDALVGRTLLGVERRGKLMIIETDGPPLGLRFGMTGRLIVDGVATIPELAYSTPSLDPEWVRFALDLDNGGSIEINDPRRLGGVVLAPELDALGPDAWTATVADLVDRLGSSTRAVKAVLLDQKRIAGLGNLLVDELCWRCGIDPRRADRDLTDDERQLLVCSIEPMLDALYERGGSTEGDHVLARENGASCPRDGSPMHHDTVGGRSTWWCPAHQR